MLKKKGFTLVELLCVIALLAVVTSIATSGILKFSIKSKENLYCAKIELIKTAAKSYARNYEKEINNSSQTYENHPSITITINDLVKKGFLSPDKDNQVLNPIDNSSLNNKEISNLENLQELLIYNSKITDISKLSNLKKLKILSLYNNNISNIEPLKNLNNLTNLYLDNNQINVFIETNNVC